MIQWQNNSPPQVPFMASIFNYYLSEDLTGYAEYDTLTLDLVKEMPGFLGYESMKFENRGMFISYWQDRESMLIWSKHPIHIEAKKFGKNKWYNYYHSAVAEVTSFHTHFLNSL